MKRIAILCLLLSVFVLPQIAGAKGHHLSTLNKKYLSEKSVALTFDDGPNLYSTPKVLDALKKKNVKATFFVQGYLVKKYPKIAKRIVDEGHQIAMHSWNHKLYTKLNSKQITKDLNKTRKIIEQTTGVSTNYFRPPYGSTSPSVRKALTKRDIIWVLWNNDTLDWSSKSSVKSVTKKASVAKKGNIVLFHDGLGKSTNKTVKALPKIIANLRGKGYSFVTSSRMNTLQKNATKRKKEQSKK